MGYFLSMTKLQWRLVYWYTNSKSVMRSIWLYQLFSMLWQIEVVLFLDVQKKHTSIILKVCQSVSHFLSVPSIQKLLFSQMVQKCRSPGKKCPTWPNRVLLYSVLQSSLATFWFRVPFPRRVECGAIAMMTWDMYQEILQPRVHPNRQNSRESTSHRRNLMAAVYGPNFN